MDAPALRSIRWLAGIAAIGPALVSFGAAVALSAGVFGLRAGLPLGYLPMAVIVWVIANHCFEVIEHKAVGNRGWPVLSIDTAVGARRQVGLAFLAWLAIVGAIHGWLVRLGQPALAQLFGVAVWLATPAAMALLGATGSPLRAIAPGAVIGTAVRLGVWYVLLLAATAGAAAMTIVAGRQRGFVALFAAAYAVLALGYAIGGAVYERRLALGVRAPRSPEALAAAEHERLLRERRHTLDHAYGIAMRGGTARALDHVRSYSRTESDALGAGVWMFHEMAHWDDPGPAVELGKELAPELEAAGRPEDAAKLRLACRYLEDRPRRRGEPR